MNYYSKVYKIDDKTYKFEIYKNNIQLTWHDVISNFCNCETFRIFFTKLFAKSKFKAVYFETPQLTNRFDPFEFVIINSNSLANIKPDFHAFEKYFDKNKLVVTFPNLSKTSKLIVPVPYKSKDYSHLMAFLKNAPSKQIHALWIDVGKQLKKVVNNCETVYLSTHGTGIYWLHVRFDKLPKYYSYLPYKLK